MSRYLEIAAITALFVASFVIGVLTAKYTPLVEWLFNALK